jgi:transcriptional regulator with XRE-family HTH domain
MTYNFFIDLKVARRKAGFTQSDVAHLLDVSQPYVSDLECGRTLPSIHELCALSLLYGRTFESFFADLVLETKQQLLDRLHTLSQDVRSYIGTFNRAHTITALQRRLTAELSLYGA